MGVACSIIVPGNISALLTGWSHDRFTRLRYVRGQAGVAVAEIWQGVYALWKYTSPRNCAGNCVEMALGALATAAGKGMTANPGLD